MHIKELARSLPHRMEDSNEFLKLVDSLNQKGIGSKEIIHTTLDITSMFSNIDKSIGLKACEEALDKREEQIPKTLCILEALELCLDNNIASFKGIIYVQMYGTATGPAFSCSYCDITVDKCIDRIVMSNMNPWRKYIPAWARFRDDIYIPWLGTAEQRMEFLNWLNSLVPSLEFVMSDIKPEGVVYLDMLVYSKDGKIHTKSPY